MIDAYELDGSRMQALPEAHDYLKETLGLPDYYGKNLDALFDCLTEITGETMLFITHAELLHPKLQQVFDDAMEHNPRLTVLYENT